MPSSKQLATWANDPAAFRASLLIDADGTPTPFKPDPWQDQDFAALDPAWRYAAGRGPAVPVRRGFLLRPRGHSKTSDLAIMTTWALLFADRQSHGIGAASDKDQARLLRDSIATLVRVNPWVQDLLDVQQWRVVNRKTGSDLEVLASDVGSSFGQLCSWIVADEISHWPGGRGEQFWASLLSTAAKRDNCVMMVIANAGYRAHWSWDVWEKVRVDPAWYSHALRGPMASWVTDQRLDEQRRLLPEQTFNRLWLNQWAEGSGDSAFLDTDIAAVFVDDLLPLSLEV